MEWGLLSMDRLAVSGLTGLMSTSPYLIATTAAAVTGTVVGGVFYAFSTFVMTGLDRAQPAEAIAASSARTAARVCSASGGSSTPS